MLIKINVLILTLMLSLGWAVPNFENSTTSKKVDNTLTGNGVEIGTIEIQRPGGVEIWNITSGNFSIDQPSERYRMNFWINSDQDLIQRLDDTGETNVAFEIKIPFPEKPDFATPWQCNYTERLSENEDDYGEAPAQGYWDNFYYYDHTPLENMKIEIVRKEDLYQIKVTGELDDPIDWQYGRAKYTITATLPLTDQYQSYWME
ncbi:MAG: hypothetical protein AAFP77_09005 [Bacteroidota bacterium]